MEKLDVHRVCLITVYECSIAIFLYTFRACMYYKLKQDLEMNSGEMDLCNFDFLA